MSIRSSEKSGDWLARDLFFEILTQIVFEKAIKGLSSYKTPAGKNARNALNNWLYKIAKNATIDYIKRSDLEFAYHLGMLNNPKKARDYEAITSKHPTIFIAGNSHAPKSPLTPQDKYLQSEEDYNALKCLEEVNNNDLREALRLQVFEELSYQEISERQGVAIGTVMSRIWRARAELKKKIERYE